MKGLLKAVFLGSFLLMGCGGGGTETAPLPAQPAQPINWQPQAGGDWSVSAASAEGLDPAKLDVAYQNGNMTAGLYALLVVKRGLLIGEAYYQGKRPADLLHLRSVTKTVVATLIGIAIAEGKIQSVDQPITDFLQADYGSLLNNKSNITLRHLLTMSSGISWDETQLSGYSDWEGSQDPTRYVLERSLLTTPGLQFNYNSGATHLLSVILTKATQQSTESYARQKLFQPLGIANWDWQQLRDGYYNGAAGLRLRARDLAKLALLWQQQGRWQQQQILPASWLLVGAERQQNVNNSVGGLNLSGYGYLWWLGQHNSRAVQLAWGYGGQFVLTMPQQDFSIIVLSDNLPSNVRQQENRVMELVVQHVLPAQP